MRKRRVQKYLQDSRGNVAVIWAFALLPLLAVVGLTLDSQIAFSKQERVQQALDSAVLAGSRMLQSSNSKSEGRAHAETYFNSMIANHSGLTCEPVVISYPADEEIQADVKCFQETTLSGIVGRDELEFNVSSTAIYGVGKLDVAFVFDISGSMNTNGRIHDLKDAASDAATTLLPLPGSSSDGDVRIAMVAYNSMINAGEYFEEVTGLKKNRTYTEETSYWTEEYEDESYIDREYQCEWVCKWRSSYGYCRNWDRECEWKDVTKTRRVPRWVEKTRTDTYPMDSTCVYERDGRSKFNDTQPKQLLNRDLVNRLPEDSKNAAETSDNEEGYLTSAHAYYDHSSDRWGTRGTSCLDIKPFELSENSTQIQHYIRSLHAGGGTAGHQGIAWGWYMISPKWKDVFDNNAEPLPYDEPNSTKAMIIMTDGDFRNEYYSGQGSSTDQAKALCDSIKQEDIVIFTVAFQAPPAGEAVLKYCASSGGHAFKASNGAELQASYQSIATSISDLRIKH